MDCSPLVALSMEFSRQGYWSGWPFPSPGDIPTQGLNLGLLNCRQILYCPSHSPGKPDLSHRGSTKYTLLRKASRTCGASKTKSQSSRERWHAGSCSLKCCRPSPPPAPGPLRLPPITPAKWSPGPFFLLLSSLLKAEVCTLGRGAGPVQFRVSQAGCTLGSHLWMAPEDFDKHKRYLSTTGIRESYLKSSFTGAYDV